MKLYNFRKIILSFFLLTVLYSQCKGVTLVNNSLSNTYEIIKGVHLDEDIGVFIRENEDSTHSLSIYNYNVGHPTSLGAPIKITKDTGDNFYDEYNTGRKIESIIAGLNHVFTIEKDLSGTNTYLSFYELSVNNSDPDNEKWNISHTKKIEVDNRIQLLIDSPIGLMTIFRKNNFSDETYLQIFDEEEQRFVEFATFQYDAWYVINGAAVGVLPNSEGSNNSDKLYLMLSSRSENGRLELLELSLNEDFTKIEQLFFKDFSFKNRANSTLFLDFMLTKDPVTGDEIIPAFLHYSDVGTKTYIYIESDDIKNGNINNWKEEVLEGYIQTDLDYFFVVSHDLDGTESSINTVQFEYGFQGSEMPFLEIFGSLHFEITAGTTSVENLSQNDPLNSILLGVIYGPPPMYILKGYTEKDESFWNYVRYDWLSSNSEVVDWELRGYGGINLSSSFSFGFGVTISSNLYGIKLLAGGIKKTSDEIITTQGKWVQAIFNHTDNSKTGKLVFLSPDKAKLNYNRSTFNLGTLEYETKSFEINNYNIFFKDFDILNPSQDHLDTGEFVLKGMAPAPAGTHDPYNWKMSQMREKGLGHNLNDIPSFVFKSPMSWLANGKQGAILRLKDAESESKGFYLDSAFNFYGLEAGIHTSRIKTTEAWQEQEFSFTWSTGAAHDEDFIPYELTPWYIEAPVNAGEYKEYATWIPDYYKNKNHKTWCVTYTTAVK